MNRALTFVLAASATCFAWAAMRAQSTSVPPPEFVGRTPVIAKRLVGHVDNSAYPAIDVEIEATEVVPVNLKGPVPVLVMFGQSALPSPAQPAPPELEKINLAMRNLLVQQDPSLKEVFDKYPAYNPISSQALNPFTGRAAGLPNDYHANAVQLPPVLHGLLDGQLAWRQHDGGHTDLHNVPFFIEWADKWRAAGPLPTAQ